MATDFSQFRQVGEFTNIAQRKLSRSMKNPMDKCTVVSILPKPIDEVKWTIDPGKFHLDPGSFENPAILVVGGSSYWREMPNDQPPLEIAYSSVNVADSIVRDYCNGVLGCDMNECVPGLFFVLGEAKVSEIKLKYKETLEITKTKQNNWFKVLVDLADSLWARTNGNPLALADDMRLAAKMLNLNDKPWLKDFQMIKMVPCPACGSLKNPMFPVCAVCKNVDQAHPASKDLKFAV